MLILPVKEFILCFFFAWSFCVSNSASSTLNGLYLFILIRWFWQNNDLAKGNVTTELICTQATRRTDDFFEKRWKIHCCHKKQSNVTVCALFDHIYMISHETVIHVCADQNVNAFAETVRTVSWMVLSFCLWKMGSPQSVWLWLSNSWFDIEFKTNWQQLLSYETFLGSWNILSPFHSWISIEGVAS